MEISEIREKLDSIRGEVISHASRIDFILSGETQLQCFLLFDIIFL